MHDSAVSLSGKCWDERGSLETRVRTAHARTREAESTCALRNAPNGIVGLTKAGQEGVLWSPMSWGPSATCKVTRRPAAWVHLPQKSSLDLWHRLCPALCPAGLWECGPPAGLPRASLAAHRTCLVSGPTGSETLRGTPSALGGKEARRPHLSAGCVGPAGPVPTWPARVTGRRQRGAKAAGSARERAAGWRQVRTEAAPPSPGKRGPGWGAAGATLRGREREGGRQREREGEGGPPQLSRGQQDCPGPGCQDAPAPLTGARCPPCARPWRWP